MHRPLTLVIALVFVVALTLPFSASAFLPIGGKILSPPIPCLHGGGYIVTVVGFGIGSGVFWYIPGITLTYLYGPPIIGEWVLGLSGVPLACGAPIIMTGTSPL